MVSRIKSFLTTRGNYQAMSYHERKDAGIRRRIVREQWGMNYNVLMGMMDINARVSKWYTGNHKGNLLKSKFVNKTRKKKYVTLKVRKL